MSIPIFFIVGKGRSGTTLLQTMLDANPEVLIPLESKFIIHLKSKYANVTVWSEQKILNFINDLHSENLFRTLWKTNAEKLKTDLLDKKGKNTFREMCEIVYLNYISPFTKKEIRLIGDKNPVNSIFIPELLKIFPEARFIHLVRDYRDNILSHITVFPVKDVAFVARKWVCFNRAVEEQKLKQPDSFLTVKYEELAQNPEVELEKICAFLKIEFRKDMLDFHVKTKETVANYGNFIERYHGNMVHPINKSKINVWKEKMKPEHIRISDYICGEYAKRYGYEKSEEEKSFEVMMNSVFSRVKLFIWIFLMNLYYNLLPMWIRKMITGFFKLLFGKDYKRKDAIV